MPTAMHRLNQGEAPARGASLLGWFVAASLLAHLWLLLGDTPSLPAAAAGPTLQLTLAPAAPSPTATAEKTAQQRAASSAPHRQRPARPAPPPGEASSAEPPAPAVGATTTAAPAPAPLAEAARVVQSEGGSAAQAVLTIRLQQALSRHFSYPLLARKKGWQGEVMLAFRLEADGRISGARIARGSGYGVLDRAALTALGKVEPIDGVPQQGLSLEIPVIYRLQEG